MCFQTIFHPGIAKRLFPLKSYGEKLLAGSIFWSLVFSSLAKQLKKLLRITSL
jgi:hypothetical protein